MQLYTWNDTPGKTAFWHSSAHVLAQSILALYPEAKLTIGPAIENGFYYDVDFDGDTISEKDFQKMRQWVSSSVDNDPVSVYRKIYGKLYDVLEKSSIPSAVLIIADYQYKSAFVADQEINMQAFMIEVMSQVQFK